MPATILDGHALAAASKEQTRRSVATLRDAGCPVKLAAIMVGEPAGAAIYAQRQAEQAAEVGIDYELLRLPAGETPRATYDAVKRRIRELNADAGVTGIMLHLPLPPGVNATRLQHKIDAVKDVEGVSPANIGYVVYGDTLIAPCTARAALELIDASGVPLEGAEATVVGASQIAGRPVSLLLTERKATVTLCQKETRDLVAHTSRADVLVVAVGRPNLIGADHVKPGACVIDIGINRVTTFDGKRITVGDVDFERVAEKAGWITPVPGGVGPMTVAMLLSNTAKAAEILAEKKGWARHQRSSPGARK